MKIILLQIDIEWQQPEINRKHIEHLIDKSEQTDMVILPEMFATGFCTYPEEIAEVAETDTLDWMQRIASEKNIALAGSIAVKENGDYFNRFYFVKPDTTYSVYDKRHLFTYGGEHRRYKGGEKKVIVEYKGFNILLQICYDLRFPVFSRNIDSQYDMILYVASWPIPRIEVWNLLLKARAIENVCFVAGVNRIGVDPTCKYNGGTAMINYLGNSIASAQLGKEETVCIEINQDDLLTFRNKFPVLDDADRFEIIE